MAKIPNNTNINDIIESSIKNIQESTKVLDTIIGDLNNIIKNISTDFGVYQNKIDNIINFTNSYISLINKISEISNINYSELKQSYKIISSTKDYLDIFVELLGDISYINSKNYTGDGFVSNVNNTIESLKALNDLQGFNIKQLINTKLYITEYEWVVNKIHDIYNNIPQNPVKVDMSSYINIINDLSTIIEQVGGIGYLTLTDAQIKLVFMQSAIMDILSALNIIDRKLASKSISKNLIDAQQNVYELINITESLVTIIDNLKKISSGKKTLQLAKSSLILLPDIFDILVQISNKIKKVKLNNNDVENVVVFTKQIVRIEKHVILMGLLSGPFAIAAVASLIFVTIGMLALRALMTIIFMVSNPVLIRAVAISMKRLAGVILMIALTIASLALTVAIILISHEMITNNLGKILETILCIGAIIVAVIALGWVMTISSPLLMAAVAGMTFVSLSLLTIMGISLLLQEIPKFNIDEERQDKIKSTVRNIIGTVKDIMNSMFGAFDEPMGSKSGNDGLVLSVSNWLLGDTFTNMIKLVLMSSVLVFTTLSIGLIFLTASALNLLNTGIVSKVVSNKGRIISNTKSIVDTSRNIINEIFGAFDSPLSDGGDGVLLGLAGWVLGDTFTNMFKLIMSCVALTFTVIAVSLVKLTAMSLNMIGDIKFNPSVVISNSQSIMETARHIISAVNSPIGTIETNKVDKSWGRELVEWVLPNGLINMVDSIMAIGVLGPTMIAVGSVSFMADCINKINDVKINSGVEEKSKQIVLIGSKLINLINSQEAFGIYDNAKAMKRISLLKTLGETISTFTKDIKVQDHEKIIDNTIKFVNTINNAKLENLQTAVNMFKQMKEFSESISGNFEGLADALNEKIAPLLEELKEMISKIPESVDKSASTISGSVYNTAAWSGGTATPSGMQEQIQKENPGMSKEDVDKIVDQRMTQQSQSIYKGMEMKMEEILEALSNHSNPIPVRMS